MQIHGICIVKDEADIMEACLTKALEWCDQIYVFDNGSTDGTWELVKNMARRHPAIVPYKQDAQVFKDSLRYEIFQAFRGRAKPGDWWCRLDADEFYVDNPRVFLAKIPLRYGLVVTVSITYYFTDRDAERYEADPELFLKQPLEERIRHYLAHWSEPRFFRHSADLTWREDDGGFPAAAAQMQIYPVRIWLRHYQYRSPEQIERRLRTRWPAIQAGRFRHEAVSNWSDGVAMIRKGRLKLNAAPEFASHSWRDRVAPAASLDFDTLDNRYIVDEALLPRIDMRKSTADRLRVLVPKPLRSAIKQVLGPSLRAAR